ncbi:hypothetical protein VP1G_06795 [Cytospora mali]|uniref:Uncharacterized protein n=1 Tax=Cytospora mali TaxID=578113 RepID=A0A194V6G8_CYTMA|nr:hypothetical protein VP1G_06795 [Valsa mali var. pyri (nom. inval.)]
MMDAFTEDEKRFVLAEYIKASQVGTEQLVEFIKSYNLQADWFSMQLPGGRNMHQCMRAASNMLDIELQFPSLPNLEPRKRKSVNDLNEQGPKRVASMTPIQYQPRPLSSHPQAHPPQHPQPQLQQALNASRAIQPRPSADATTEGYRVFQSKSPSNGYSVFQSNPTVRKRGRPSKAEKEAQARANSNPYSTNTPVPISPKPAIPPAVGAVATGFAASGASHSSPVHRIPPVPASSRSAKEGGTGAVGEMTHGLSRTYMEQPASSARSEKSPSIGNLVTSDPSIEQHKVSAPSLGRVPVHDPPPVTNSA